MWISCLRVEGFNLDHVFKLENFGRFRYVGPNQGGGPHPDVGPNPSVSPQLGLAIWPANWSASGQKPEIILAWPIGGLLWSVCEDLWSGCGAWTVVLCRCGGGFVVRCALLWSLWSTLWSLWSHCGPPGCSLWSRVVHLGVPCGRHCGPCGPIVVYMGVPCGPLWCNWVFLVVP